MKLYHFPSPNPQKVTFALLELGPDCEQIRLIWRKENSENRNSWRSIPQGGFRSSSTTA